MKESQNFRNNIWLIQSPAPAHSLMWAMNLFSSAHRSRMIFIT